MSAPEDDTVTRTALGVMQALGVICDLAALAQEYGDATAAYYDAAGTVEESPRCEALSRAHDALMTAVVSGFIDRRLAACAVWKRQRDEAAKAGEVSP